MQHKFIIYLSNLKIYRSFFRIFAFKSFSHHTLFHIIFLTYKFFTLEIKMGKEKHNFREFFYLCTPDNPKSNKKAVCFSCIRKYTLPLAISKPECFVPNKALLCRNHLKKCENF